MLDSGRQTATQPDRDIRSGEITSASDSTPWVGIAANANSGLGAGRKRVQRLVEALGKQGLPARVAWTLDEREAIVDAARSDANCRCLVAAGGDGTVAALLNEQPTVPVTVLPAGTENLFAQHFRVRSRPESVAAMIAEGRTVPLDLGLAGGRRFALMAGIGFDADVVTRHHRARVGSAGKVRPTHRAAYVSPVLESSWSYRFPPLTVEITDPGHEEVLTGSTVFLFNLPRYALGLPFAPDARGDDGLLDLVVFDKPGALNALGYLWLVFRGLHRQRDGITHRRVRRVVVSAPEEVPVQLDGDPGGQIDPSCTGPPWTAEVVPQAVRILVPASYALCASA